MIGENDAAFTPVEGPDPQLIEGALNGQRWAGLMPDIAGEIERAKAQVAARVYKMINDSSLTPEGARLAWMELHALDKMLKRFTSKVKLGLSMGQTFAEQLNQGETDNG